MQGKNGLGIGRSHISSEHNGWPEHGNYLGAFCALAVIFANAHRIDVGEEFAVTYAAYHYPVSGDRSCSSLASAHAIQAGERLL